MASFLARASVSLPVVLLIFFGAGIPSVLSMAANFGFDARSFSSTSSFCSKASRVSLSSSIALSSIRPSSTNVGSVYIRSVMSISLSSFVGYPTRRAENMCSHKNTSCLQYSASSSSICSSSSRSPSVECRAFPLAGRPKALANRARELPTSTPRKARAIDRVSRMKAGVTLYFQERIDTSNWALWARSAVRPQSTPETYLGISHPLTHSIGWSLPYRWKHAPKSVNLSSRMYSSVVILLSVNVLLSQYVSKSTVMISSNGLLIRCAPSTWRRRRRMRAPLRTSLHLLRPT